MTVISFYTKGTAYEEEVKRLTASCSQFGIDAQIEGIDSLGSWEKNCGRKPHFILEKLEQLKRPVFWVDADAAFLQPFSLEPFAGWDFSVRVNEFLPKTHPSRIVTNAIYVNYSPQGIAILEKWCAASDRELNRKDRQEECWDQIPLRNVLVEEGIDFFPMPLKYAKIFDFDDLFISQEEVVIEHYQASRRLKRLVHAHLPDHCCH